MATTLARSGRCCSQLTSLAAGPSRLAAVRASAAAKTSPSYYCSFSSSTRRSALAGDTVPRPDPSKTYDHAASLKGKKPPTKKVSGLVKKIAGSGKKPAVVAGKKSAAPAKKAAAPAQRKRLPAATTVVPIETTAGTAKAISLAAQDATPLSEAAAKRIAVPATPVYRRQRREVAKQQRLAARRERRGQSLAAKLGVKQSKYKPLVRMDHQFKTFKPITPSIRWLRYNVNPHLHGGEPVRALTIAKRGHGGRNHHGHVTVRGRGGGHKRRIRLVDFWRWEDGPQTVVRIEYDPGRSAHIALLNHQETGKVSYILAPDGLRAGDEVRSYRSMADGSDEQDKSSGTAALDLGIFRTQAVRPGNVLPLHLIPVGTTIHALSLVPHGPAKIIRSAGSSGRVVAFVNRNKSQKTPSSSGAPANALDDSTTFAGQPDGHLSPNVPSEEVLTRSSSHEGQTEMTTHAQVRLQSGEVRLVPVKCVAAIGRVSNIDHKHRRLGKAGRSRWLGRRPKVRGMAMNAVDHPHGGGRGKSKGNKHPMSIYGNKAEGRTRKPGTRKGNKMVVKERPRQLGARKK